MSKNNKFPPLELDEVAVSSPPISCPICKKANFDARALQYEIWRKCRECGNEWSGGSMGAALKEPPALTQPRGPTIPNKPAPLAEDDPELDLPTFTGAPYRQYGEE